MKSGIIAVDRDGLVSRVNIRCDCDNIMQVDTDAKFNGKYVSIYKCGCCGKRVGLTSVDGLKAELKDIKLKPTLSKLEIFKICDMMAEDMTNEITFNDWGIDSDYPDIPINTHVKNIDRICEKWLSQFLKKEWLR